MFYNKFYVEMIPLNILNNIDTSLFSPHQLIKIYLNNIYNKKNFLLDISKKNVINIDKDIYEYFNKSITYGKKFNINNKDIILSVIVFTHFSHLFKTCDLIKYKKQYTMPN